MKAQLVAALIAGAAIGAGGYWLADRPQAQESGAATHDMSSMAAEMDSMSAGLAGLSGDAFDRKFIETMIEHHQGAIQMAHQAHASAQHPEIKALAGEIVSAQTREIEQMQAWQKAWGYR